MLNHILSLLRDTQHSSIRILLKPQNHTNMHAHTYTHMRKMWHLVGPLSVKNTYWQFGYWIKNACLLQPHLGTTVDNLTFPLLTHITYSHIATHVTFTKCFCYYWFYCFALNAMDCAILYYSILNILLASDTMFCFLFLFLNQYTE